MRFRKFHGLGNDFVMLTDLEGSLGPPESLSRELVAGVCDRHTGVGSDGLIRVMRDGDTLRMDYYNADGGPAEMCGNGIRCLAVLAQSDGLLGPGEHEVLTGAGPVRVRVDGSDRVTVDMGVPSLERADVPMTGTGSALRVGVELADGTCLEGTGVSMGNPHLVLFLDDLGRAMSDALVHGLGPEIEHHAAFPQRTNVEFVQVDAPDALTMRVWERGVGETQACGSGACAAAVAAAALERSDRRVRVTLPGGTLDLEWASDDHVWMTGPAEEAFAGELDASWLEARGLRSALAATGI